MTAADVVKESTAAAGQTGVTQREFPRPDTN